MYVPHITSSFLVLPWVCLGDNRKLIVGKYTTLLSGVSYTNYTGISIRILHQKSSFFPSFTEITLPPYLHLWFPRMWYCRLQWKRKDNSLDNLSSFSWCIQRPDTIVMPVLEWFVYVRSAIFEIVEIIQATASTIDNWRTIPQSWFSTSSQPITC